MPANASSLHNSQSSYQLWMPSGARFIFPMLATDLCVVFELSQPNPHQPSPPTHPPQPATSLPLSQLATAPEIALCFSCYLPSTPALSVQAFTAALNTLHLSCQTTLSSFPRDLLRGHDSQKCSPVAING